MTRVSENSNTVALNHALNRAKTKLEDLQLKGSTLKSIRKPSDNPVANVEALSIGSLTKDNEQYIKNAHHALLQLNVTEKSLAQLSEILIKAKEIAVAQSSDFYHGDIRKNVAMEVVQLRNQALTISNKRIGNRYLFSGTKTLSPAFNQEGEYLGDNKAINLEVSKDFFIPINLNGAEVFFTLRDQPNQSAMPQGKFPTIQKNEEDDRYDVKDDIENNEVSRSLASVDENENPFHERSNLLAQLQTLSTALETNDSGLIQGLLESFDDSISRLITLRTRVGSIVKSIEVAQDMLQSDNIDHAARKSQLVDADIADLFANLIKQQQVLKTTYQASSNLTSKTLLDFLR